MQVAVLTYPGMTALDAVGPYEVLRFMPEANVRFVWHQVGPVITDSGSLVLGATHTLDETAHPDIVVVPGGPAATVVAADESVLAWLRGVHETSTWTTSVCTGALILAAAGLLDGRPATTHWAAQSLLATLGAHPRPDERFVHSDRIATAAGVSAGIDMALWLVGQLCGTERARIIQLDIEYDPQPPFDMPRPAEASASIRRAALGDQWRLGLSSGMAPQIAASLPSLLWRTAIRKVRARRR
ncbi:DJ-1/PfpI family protein [Nocardia sp. NPDC050378]|uniref:DJ-1/PfpI family protein n=1 Tax=Nocardia sp. NPDC050378 TaxID=3155400 RepID=UPI003410A47F